MKRLSLVLLLVLASGIALLAQRTIRGTITDDQGEPLIGATVLAKGTSVGSVSDIDGSYALSVPEGVTTLVFSYTGFSTQEVQLGASDVVDVSMSPDIAQLSEVVVTGYSETQRKKLVASVSTIDNKALENVPLPDVNQLIQGRAPGVFSTAASGQPGAAQNVRVRGTGSITAGRGPLYVIDGVIVQSGDFSQQATSNDILSNINPNDIDNVSILKDAAATALYGSRGSNGVILITTKRGRAGKSVISAKMQYGITQPNIGNFDLMNGQEIWDYERQVLANSGRTPEQIDAARPASLLDNDFDWVDAAFRQGQTRNLELQASGGNDKTRFFLSGGYFTQDGILIDSDFSRLSLRSNIDHTASDKLDFSLNFNTSYTENLNAVAGNRFASPLLGAFVNTPLQPAYNPATGQLYTGLEDAWTIFSGDNFLYSSPLNPVVNENLRIIAKVAANYNILKNLRFSQTANIDYVDITENVFQDPTTGDGSNTNGSITDSYTGTNTLTTQSMLKYYNSFGADHNFDAFAVFEYQKFDDRRFTANGVGLASGKLKTLNSTATPQGVTGTRTEFAFVSLLGQANYNFREKYFLTASVRNDGSSRFGANNRYATFYSIGASWALSEEAFLDNINLINNLRLRASYGTSGNAEIGNFPSQELYGFGNSYDDQPGSSPTQIANPDLTWEVSKNVNVGLDFAVLENRLSGSIEWYQRRGEDLLLNVPVSSTSGFQTALRNIGKIENKGFEVNLSATIFRSSNAKGFNWNIDANFSANRNKILELPGGEDILNGRQIWRVGEPIRAFNMQVWAGVDPANGKPLWETAEGTTSTYSQAVRKIVGNAEPDFLAGLNNTFSFAGFSLSAFFNTVQGHEIYNGSRPFVESDGQRYGQFNNIVEAGQNYWKAPGDIALRPQPKVGGNSGSNSASSRYLEDGSYIRLRNVTLGYTLPKSVLDKMRLSNVLFYVQGQNLLTITDYSGFDPEAEEDGDEFFRYPVGKSFTFGLDISF
ncbi:MAG: TonB-dependent receptor [Saprospiraceae bacterium]|nr:TonB-dependent receptor [Saprospiraceae bacterium]